MVRINEEMQQTPTNRSWKEKRFDGDRMPELVVTADGRTSHQGTRCTKMVQSCRAYRTQSSIVNPQASHSDWCKEIL